MPERIDCTRKACKDEAKWILERNGRPYCKPHALALALRLPRCDIHRIDDIEDREGILAEHIAADALSVCKGMKVNGVYVKGCGTMIVWATLTSGHKLPLETEAIPHPRAGLVAYNPSTGGGKVLTKEDVESGRAISWSGKFRMTFHRTHFATKRCPVVQARIGKKAELPIEDVA